MENDGYNSYLGKAYRFISFEGLYATIENETLRYSRGDTFNDPLDMSPFIAPFDWEQFPPDNFRKIEKLAFDTILSTLYVCCFCKEFDSDDSYLMWSHYAEKHTQVCFEIDFSIYKNIGAPSEVTYPADMVAERTKTKHRTPGQKGLHMATSKLMQWQYEKEVRLLVDTKHPKTATILSNKSEDGKHIYVKFDLNCISKVIFGANAAPEDIDKTQNLLKEKKLSPEYYIMQVDPLTLKLKPIKLPV